MIKAVSLVVLISGNGSNLQAIIDAIAAKKLNAQIKAVISSKRDAYGLDRAKRAGIQTETLLPRDFESRSAYDSALSACIDRYKAELIILAGFMRILGQDFVDRYPNRILNIHPALLPKYQGLNTHARVLAAGDLEHGATVHIVTSKLDEGPILGSAKLVIRPDDTEQTLQERVLALEHQLYPAVIQEFFETHMQNPQLTM